MAGGNVLLSPRLDQSFEAASVYHETAIGGGTVTTTTRYDPNGNVVQVTDPNSNVATFTYDALDRLTSKTIQRGGGVSDTVTYTYDQANPITGASQIGLLAWKTNGNGAQTVYTYDADNRVTQVNYAYGTTASWSESVTYDVNGNVHSRTDGNGNTNTYVYDNENRLIEVDHPQTRGGSEYIFGAPYTYSYDAAGHLHQMTDWDGATTWTYDEVGRLLTLSSPQGNINYGYDDLNRMITRSISGNSGSGSWTWNYDTTPAANGGTTYLLSSTDPTSTTASYAYDLLGRLSTVTHGNGMSTGYFYDGLGRTTDLIHYAPVGSTTPVADYTHLEYDAGGRIVSYTSGTDANTRYYTYDGADQLLSERRVINNNSLLYEFDYSYDHNGNRLTKVQPGVTTQTFTYDIADKLLHFVDSTSGFARDWYYNGDGSLNHFVQFGALAQSIDYDFEGHAVNFQPYAIDPTTGALTTDPAYAGLNKLPHYNALGMRVEVQDRITPNGRTFLAEGQAPGSPLLGDSMAVYTPGENERRSGVNRWNLDDGVGSRSTMVDSTGSTVTDYWDYDAFGQQVNDWGNGPGSTPSVPESPNRYGGRYGYQYDSDMGYSLLGHRYYDALSGRFISRDPAGDGENWYAYCGNDPVDGSDPTGLYWQLMTTTISWPPDENGKPRSSTWQHWEWFPDEQQSPIRGFSPSVNRILSGAKNALKPVTKFLSGGGPYLFGPPSSGYAVNDPGAWAASILAQGILAAATDGESLVAEDIVASNVLYHYTTEEGMNGIVESELLNPSLKALNPSDARYGDGQYLTDIVPGTKTTASLSATFLKIPFQGQRFTNYVGIDVTGLNVVQGRPGVFVVPNEGPLSLTGRIVSFGANK